MDSHYIYPIEKVIKMPVFDIRSCKMSNEDYIAVENDEMLDFMTNMICSMYLLTNAFSETGYGFELVDNRVTISNELGSLISQHEWKSEESNDHEKYSPLKWVTYGDYKINKETRTYEKKINNKDDGSIDSKVFFDSLGAWTEKQVRRMQEEETHKAEIKNKIKKPSEQKSTIKCTVDEHMPQWKSKDEDWIDEFYNNDEDSDNVSYTDKLKHVLKVNSHSIGVTQLDQELWNLWDTTHARKVFLIITSKTESSRIVFDWLEQEDNGNIIDKLNLIEMKIWYILLVCVSECVNTKIYTQIRPKCFHYIEDINAMRNELMIHSERYNNDNEQIIQWLKDNNIIAYLFQYLKWTTSYQHNYCWILEKPTTYDRIKTDWFNKGHEYHKKLLTKLYENETVGVCEYKNILVTSGLNYIYKNWVTENRKYEATIVEKWGSVELRKLYRQPFVSVGSGGVTRSFSKYMGSNNNNTTDANKTNDNNTTDLPAAKRRKRNNNEKTEQIFDKLETVISKGNDNLTFVEKIINILETNESEALKKFFESFFDTTKGNDNSIDIDTNNLNQSINIDNNNNSTDTNNLNQLIHVDGNNLNESINIDNNNNNSSTDTNNLNQSINIDNNNNSTDDNHLNQLIHADGNHLNESINIDNNSNSTDEPMINNGESVVNMNIF